MNHSGEDYLAGNDAMGERAARDRTTLVLGGTRSGKSLFAESLTESASETAAGGRLVYVATGEAFDDEMRARIASHQARRGPNWNTCAAPIELVEALCTGLSDDDTALIDCVSVWIGNLMHHERNVDVEVDKLIECVAASKANLVIVSTEVGLGIVPDNAMARRFRDVVGDMNQRLAAVADEVYLVTAGIPLTLK